MDVHACIRGGLAFLRSQQSADGFWSDWNLPPGASRMWTTAYIGYRLGSLRSRQRASIEEPLVRAETWLRRSEFDCGGWGYSEHTGPDADSTALAILFLKARGVVISERSVVCLAAHQQHDGGFSTYTRDASFGAWVHSHPEVTAVAALALLDAVRLDRTRLSCAIQYVLTQQRTDAMWNSFWWESSLYATEASLALINRRGQPFDRATVCRALRQVEPGCAFNRALRLLCLTHAGGDATVSADDSAALCATQSADGSWPSAPVLRLTRRECSEPWRSDDAGPLFADERRVFTTATVIAALAALNA